MVHFGALKTKNGYTMDEVASALQKCLRRGLDEDAIYWAAELDRSGYGNYAWSRIKVMLSEDCGIALPVGFTADVWALFQAWKFSKADFQFTIDAIQRICRAPKTRIADTAFIAVWNNAESFAGNLEQEFIRFPHALENRQEEEALRLAAQFSNAGESDSVWAEIVSAPVVSLGLDSGAISDIRALYEMWLELAKKKSPSAPIHTIHAIQRICRLDYARGKFDFDAAWEYFDGREIPDFALGMHTTRGRKMGRGIEDFYQNGATLHPDAGIPDPYYDRAVGIDQAEEAKKKPKSPEPRQTTQLALIDEDDVLF